jgi:hypothetical protein
MKLQAATSASAGKMPVALEGDTGGTIAFPLPAGPLARDHPATATLDPDA